jgi:hypothetical protein
MMPSSPRRTYACGSHGSALGAKGASVASSRRTPSVLAATSKPPIPNSFMKSRRCVSNVPVDTDPSSGELAVRVIQGSRGVALIVSPPPPP